MIDKIADMLNHIYNENCMETMKRIPENYIDIILTSPFYNTNKKAGKNKTLINTSLTGYPYIRYDTHVDNMTDEQYNVFTVKIFNSFNKILKNNGVVIYNLNYGGNNREGMIKAIYAVITETPFTIADIICWKKHNATPNNCSPNKLTRIWEFVFVLCRKNEINTYYCNKKIKGYRKMERFCPYCGQRFVEKKN